MLATDGRHETQLFSANLNWGGLVFQMGASLLKRWRCSEALTAVLHPQCCLPAVKLLTWKAQAEDRGGSLAASGL